MSVRSRLDSDEVRAFCRRWKIIELAVFGSVARGEDQADSDIDLLATFAQDAQWSLFDHVAMEEELEAILGRCVDLLTRRSVEASANAVRRSAILEGATPIYVEG